MRPEECPRLGECLEVRRISAEDKRDFQYIQTMRDVCASCTEVGGDKMDTATPHNDSGKPGFIKRYLLEALYAGVAEAEGDKEMAKSLRARTKLRLISMSDEQLLAFIIAIAQHGQLVESVYAAFQNAKAEHKATASEWMKDLLPNAPFEEEGSDEVQNPGHWGRADLNK